jgi:hypothetical protein
MRALQKAALAWMPEQALVPAKDFSEAQPAVVGPRAEAASASGPVQVPAPART